MIPCRNWLRILPIAVAACTTPTNSASVTAAVPVVPHPEDPGDLVVRRPAQDDCIDAAKQSAHGAWKDFAGAYGAGNCVCSVKLPLAEGPVVEHMWILVTSLDDNNIGGIVSGVPRDLMSLHEGSIVSASVAEVDDWVIFAADDSRVGFFSANCLGQ